MVDQQPLGIGRLRISAERLPGFARLLPRPLLFYDGSIARWTPDDVVFVEA